MYKITVGMKLFCSFSSLKFYWMEVQEGVANKMNINYLPDTGPIWSFRHLFLTNHCRNYLPYLHPGNKTSSSPHIWP